MMSLSSLQRETDPISFQTMVVKRFTNLGLVGRGGGGGGGDSESEEMGEEEGELREEASVVEERDLITDNLGHIGR